ARDLAQRRARERRCGRDGPRVLRGLGLRGLPAEPHPRAEIAADRGATLDVERAPVRRRRDLEPDLAAIGRLERAPLVIAREPERTPVRRAIELEHAARDLPLRRDG